MPMKVAKGGAYSSSAIVATVVECRYIFVIVGEGDLVAAKLESLQRGSLLRSIRTDCKGAKSKENDDEAQLCKGG
jgi:hypothetical protein